MKKIIIAITIAVMTAMMITGCKVDRPIMTNDLLHRETIDTSVTSGISQYL